MNLQTSVSLIAVACLVAAILLTFAVFWGQRQSMIRKAARRLEQMLHNGVIDAIGTVAFNPWGESSEVRLAWQFKGVSSGTPYSYSSDMADWPEHSTGPVPEEVLQLLRQHPVETIEFATKQMRRSNTKGFKITQELVGLKRSATARMVLIERLAA